MKIRYNCKCDDWTKILIKSVLKKFDTKSNEFVVQYADCRRIYLRTQVWCPPGGPIFGGMVMGNWEYRTWVIKYSYDGSNKYNTTLNYILFDTKPSKITEHANGHLLLTTPTFIDSGTYKISRGTKNKAVFTEITYDVSTDSSEMKRGVLMNMHDFVDVYSGPAEDYARWECINHTVEAVVDYVIQKSTIPPVYDASTYNEPNWYSVPTEIITQISSDVRDFLVELLEREYGCVYPRLYQ